MIFTIVFQIFWYKNCQLVIDFFLVLDSTAKIPAGLLRGNVNQFGDFDQCLGISTRVKISEQIIKIQGKYCLATVDLHAIRPHMKVPENLMQGRAFIRGNMHDVSTLIAANRLTDCVIFVSGRCTFFSYFLMFRSSGD